MENESTQTVVNTQEVRDNKNLYFKIQTIRNAISKMKLPKSGYNKYKEFKYYELADFLPQILEQCLSNKIMTLFQLGEGKATLEVSDFETNEMITWHVPFERPQIQGAQAIQNLGGAITYMRRYLYSMAFEIVDNDELDATIGQKGAAKKNQQNQQTNKTQATQWVLSDAQRKRMFTIATNSGYSTEKVKELMLQRYKIDSSSKLTKQQYDDFCQYFQKHSLKMPLADAIKYINMAKDSNDLKEKHEAIKKRVWTYEEKEQIDLACHDKNNTFQDSYTDALLNEMPGDEVFVDNTVGGMENIPPY